MGKRDDHTDQNLPVTAQRLVAVTRTGAVIVFFILGFAFHLWAIAWVAFLFPELIRKWYSVQEPARPNSRPNSGYGSHEVTDEARPYPY